MPITQRACYSRFVLSALPAAAILCGFVVTIAAQQTPVSDRFYQAIRTNDLAALEGLIAENGANVKDSLGLTPLILATAFGTKDAVEVLVFKGC